MQHAPTKEWTSSGKILKKFDVKISDGRVLKRNQQFLRKLYIHLTSVEVPTTIPIDELSDNDDTIALSGGEHNNICDGGPMFILIYLLQM